MINHWLRLLLCTVAVVTGLSVYAQTPQCKDTVEHRRLQSAMWESSKGQDADSVYEAIRTFQKHVDAEKDFEGHYSAWMCGVSFNLDRLNICDAYHVAVMLKDDLKNGMGGKEEQYMGLASDWLTVMRRQSVWAEASDWTIRRKQARVSLSDCR